MLCTAKEMDTLQILLTILLPLVAQSSRLWRTVLFPSLAPGSLNFPGALARIVWVLCGVAKHVLSARCELSGLFLAGVAFLVRGPVARTKEGGAVNTGW